MFEFFRFQRNFAWIYKNVTFESRIHRKIKQMLDIAGLNNKPLLDVKSYCESFYNKHFDKFREMWKRNEELNEIEVLKNEFETLLSDYEYKKSIRLLDKENKSINIKTPPC
ncbi:hypothetical protein RF11_08898 [Thelohanellus kitauei]|uniref:Uncharacterized protein n=1 Tax=Thelohanellus kitauei TaxID=669202 RepID=A0A0C2MYI0_THEKT|nr:hypothetical protein RF11_08898 [Thelohanellus kitauei]